jgi:hypothetical protein
VQNWLSNASWRELPPTISVESPDDGPQRISAAENSPHGEPSYSTTVYGMLRYAELTQKNGCHEHYTVSTV